MARGTQHRKRRPPANARVVAPPPKKDRVKHASWEDQLFFTRLRVHAKWVFVLLALAFGLGFVLFGVGSGSSGIANIMQNFFSSTSSGGSSLSSLQKKAQDNQKDPTAWRNLATKLEQSQKPDRAIIALEHYTKLRPKDQNAFQELAGLFQQRATAYDALWAQALQQLDVVGPSSVFQPTTGSTFAKAFPTDPITALVVSPLQAQANAAGRNVGIYASKAVTADQQLVKLAPENATYQFQLADIAQSLGEKPVAKKAYEAFLKLAPNDSLAPRAKQQLKLLSPPPAKKK